MRNEQALILSVSGVDGDFDLYSDRLELRRKGVATKLFRGFNSIKVYPILEIGDIRIADPPSPFWGGPRGTATVSLIGSYSAPTRAQAVKDQDSILLARKKDADAVRALLERIRQLQLQASGRGPEAPLMEVSGADGRVLLYRNRVVVTHVGTLSKINRGSTGISELRIRDITGVQLKKPGATKGYIQFSAPGHFNNSHGVFGAVRDGLSVMIANGKQFDEFRQLKVNIDRLRDELHQPVETQTNPSVKNVADELEKLHALRERGILTQEEFDIQKQKILS